MSSSAIIWLIPYPPKVIIWHRLLHTESISYVVCHHLAYSLTPLCHHVIIWQPPPQKKNVDVICEQLLKRNPPLSFHAYTNF